MRVFTLFDSSINKQTDGSMNRPMDWRMDKVSYRVASPRLKISIHVIEISIIKVRCTLHTTLKSAMSISWSAHWSVHWSTCKAFLWHFGPFLFAPAQIYDLLFSRGRATLHLAVSVGPSVHNIFESLLPNHSRLDCRVSGLVSTQRLTWRDQSRVTLLAVYPSLFNFHRKSEITGHH